MSVRITPRRTEEAQVYYRFSTEEVMAALAASYGLPPPPSSAEVTLFAGMLGRDGLSVHVELKADDADYLAAATRFGDGRSA